MKENDDRWVYVPPMEDTFTVILGKSKSISPDVSRRERTIGKNVLWLTNCDSGDMMQYLTSSFLKSTPHKVGLNNSERHTIAYFHEPNFKAVVKPLKELRHCNKSYSAPPSSPDNTSSDEGVHYGTHFTNMFMRNYPDRVTTKRLVAENRYDVLATDELRTMDDMDANEVMCA